MGLSAQTTCTGEEDSDHAAGDGMENVTEQAPVMFSHR